MKSKRAPGAPKRPQSSYLIWLNEHRQGVVDKHPDLAFGEITKILGKMWSAMTDADKAPYNAKAEEAKAEYTAAKAAYDADKAAHPEKYPDAPTKSGKKPKDPNAPKPAVSAYIAFSTEQRPLLKQENPDLSFGELAKQVGAKWGSLDEAQKAKYNAIAEADKTRYSKELAEYEARTG